MEENKLKAAFDSLYEESSGPLYELLSFWVFTRTTIIKEEVKIAADYVLVKALLELIESRSNSIQKESAEELWSLRES